MCRLSDGTDDLQLELVEFSAWVVVILEFERLIELVVGLFEQLVVERWLVQQ